ncbi:MAG: glycosyltransferase family 2 protein [Planctomycetota bacterium]|nr:glycosyltransferase family 2 protein [Planctomycetota bacterium]
MNPTLRIAVAIPVFNECNTIARVLSEVRARINNVVVFDDGSTDDSASLAEAAGVPVVRHPTNLGYGAVMQSVLRWAHSQSLDWVITMDCDEQHEPASIPAFLDAIRSDDSDVLSGSRYLEQSKINDAPPAGRRRINGIMTSELNALLKLNITDSFCGFKAYRVSACAPLQLSCPGYEFPIEFWIRAAEAGLRIRELPVSLIYNDPNRSFGGVLDDDRLRLEHYRQTLQQAVRCGCGTA